MRVLVIRQFSYVNENDLRIIMIARAPHGENMVSPVVTLEGAAGHASGNPYSVFGDACAEFTGEYKFDLKITVADCVSGNLDGWE